MRIIIGAGGTGGHIIPAIGIALELSQRHWDIAFIGNKHSMEEGIVHKYQFRFMKIHVQKIYRKLTFEHLKFPFLFFNSLLLCLMYINKFRPDAVLCTGGFVSGPVAIAAIILGVPLYIQDGNNYPGLTTRMLSRYAKKVFIASEFAKRYLKADSCVITGNPLLKYEKIDTRQIKWESYNLSPTSLKLFVIGGSQGSVIINKIVGKCLDELLKRNIEVIWQTGKTHKSTIVSKYGSIKGVHIFDFTDKMSQYYQMADIAISRAGALSIAELEEHRIPAIFIPLPTAAENHQYKNAVTQVEKGVGLIVEQKLLTVNNLMDSIAKILSNIQSYKENLKLLPENHASQTIADIIEQETKSS